MIGNGINTGTTEQISVKKDKLIESDFERSYNRNLFAEMRLDISSDIDDISILHDIKIIRPAGSYSVKVDIYFNCPSNRKIIVAYSITACLIEPDYDPWPPDPWVLTFCSISNSTIIVNGSNPPEISELYMENVPVIPCFVDLKIHADLKEYKYIDGEWILIGQHDKDKMVYYPILFYKSITKSGLQYLKNSNYNFRNSI